MITSPNNLSVYLSEQIRSIEYAVKRQSPTPTLMQRAGLAAANFATQLVPRNAKILLFAGSGDNGGDAFEMAAQLSQQGYAVSIYTIGDGKNYSTDALASLTKAKENSVNWINNQQVLVSALENAALIVDGLFGIGLSRAITGPTREVISLINQTSAKRSIPVLALDIPSGLMADTGQVFQDVAQTEGRAAVVRANHTITFIAYKPGLFTAKGRDLAGQVVLDTLGIDPNDYPTNAIALNTKENTKFLLPQRLHDSNKGSNGNVSIIGGAHEMRGAPILGARAALYAGAGKVHIGFCSEGEESPIPFDALYPEIMCHIAKYIDLNEGVIAIGPGLGTSDKAKEILTQALIHSPQLVIDADAINLIAGDTDLQDQLSLRTNRKQISLLTPHPLEAARLLSTDTAEVQADRLSAARQLSEKYKAVFILKGSGSIISNGCQCFINTSGNPALATGGTGDVLAGLCAALLAQGLTAFDAARLACFVHGAAADQLVAQGIGPIGLVASELAAAIRQQLNH